MHRRILLAGMALSVPSLSWAHHGWRTYDEARPLYLEGVVSTITWADPHAQLELQLEPELQLPPGLADRDIPAQRDPVDLRGVLTQAVLPAEGGRQWRVLLAPLARLVVWEVPRPKVGDRLGVVGYPGPDSKGDPTLRAEVLFVGRGVYPMRADPAGAREPRS